MTLIDCFPDPAPLRQALLDWFSQNARTLPWRACCAPYEVWVSEMMLQQTQMERGVAFFKRWMQRFPDVAALAAASEEDVLKTWEGLGYYSRARSMLRAARRIMENGGAFPVTETGWRSLPGVGPYTAAAVASIAYNIDTACVDANVTRVICRLCDLDESPAKARGKSLVAALASELLTPGQARRHNQAIMELGALVCGKSPDCTVCPLRHWCLALARGTIASRPVPVRRPEIVRITMASGLLVRHGRVYVQRRLPNDVWGGLWEFPGGCAEEGELPCETVVREFREETGFCVRVTDGLGVIRSSRTKYHITVHFYAVALEDEKTAAGNAAAGCVSLWPDPELHEADAWRWVDASGLQSLAMPSPYRKMADALVSPDGTLCIRPATRRTKACPGLPLHVPKPLRPADTQKATPDHTEQH